LTAVSKTGRSRISPIGLAAWQIGIGCLPVAVVGLVLEQPQLAALSATGWASMIYLTLIQFCLCYVCWFAALERLPAATASIGTLLVPLRRGALGCGDAARTLWPTRVDGACCRPQWRRAGVARPISCVPNKKSGASTCAALNAGRITVTTYGQGCRRPS
jgi:EamA-like transporter family